MKNYYNYNSAETFFIELLRENLCINARYTCLPRSTCFNYCINELIKALEIHIESNKKINHLDLAQEFFSFLKKDTILKMIDESEYYNLLCHIKNIVGKSSVISEEYTYLKRIKSFYGAKYFKQMCVHLKILLDNNTPDLANLEFIALNLINELLAQNISYLFLCQIFNDYYFNDKFDNINQFLTYIYNEENTENIQIYLPLKGCAVRDIKFLSDNNQKVVTIEEKSEKTHYCLIYANTVDYYNLFEINKRRIESIFNFFKFFRDSNMDFDYDKKIRINRNKILKDTIEIDFKKFVTNKSYIGKQQILDTALKNLKILSETENILYFKICNILHYAEKDNDFLTSNSFVDNWIALESLIKLSDFRVGYDGVRYIIPKALSTKYFRQEINQFLKQAYNVNMSLESFISYCLNGNEEKLYKNVKTDYHKYKIDCYKKALSNIELFKAKLEEIEKCLANDIQRIYIIRNEYVHSSNISTNNILYNIKLKRILSESIDCFMKTLDANLKPNYNNVTGSEIFNDILRQHDNAKNIIAIYCNKFTIEQKIGKKNLISDIDMQNVIKNIVFEKKALLRICEQFT